MTKPSDPVQYAMYLRTGNVIEIGENRYEVKGGTYDNSKGTTRFAIELELISIVLPDGAKRPSALNATLIVDPRTIIPVIE